MSSAGYQRIRGSREQTAEAQQANNANEEFCNEDEVEKDGRVSTTEALITSIPAFKEGIEWRFEESFESERTLPTRDLIGNRKISCRAPSSANSCPSIPTRSVAK